LLLVGVLPTRIRGFSYLLLGEKFDNGTIRKQMIGIICYAIRICLHTGTKASNYCVRMAVFLQMELERGKGTG